MDVRSSKRRLGRSPMKSFLIVAAAFALVLTPGVVLAYSNYGTDFEAAHPGTQSFVNGDCELCHSESTKSQWNAYGNAVREEFGVTGDMPSAILNVDAANSDGDPTGATNAAEATANTQPGWVYGPNNSLYDSGGSVVSTGVLPPTSITGKLDPVTLVTIGDSAFAPAAVAPKLGTVVQWIPSGSLNHNVHEVGGIFTSGAAKAATYYNRIVSAGTFSYNDEAHPTMTGTIKVKPKTAAAPTGTSFTVTWATTKTNTGAKFNVQYAIGTGVWKNWYASTGLQKAVFGAGGLPIVPKAGTKYSFRVRSGSSTAWSGYSPAKAYTP